MAITIRNKTTEELIRKIGRRTGEGPSAVVRRLAENENREQSIEVVSEEEIQRRLAVFDELAKRFPPPDDGRTWTEIEEEMDSIFGGDLK